MQKYKKGLITASYMLFGFVGLSALEVIVTFLRGYDVAKDFPELEADYYPLAIGCIVGAAVVSWILHLWLGFWGLSKARAEKPGGGHFVLQFILAVYAFYNLYLSIGGISGSEDTLGTVINIVIAVIWIVVLLTYDWFAINFSRACKEKNGGK